MTKDIGTKTKKGIFWTILFNLFRNGIHFISGIILARLLFPNDFGLMGVAMIVIQFARRLANFGFSMVLVQLKEIKAEHYDTVFIFNSIIMGSITIGLIFASPYLAKFFNNEQLAPILMVISLEFILKAFFSVPRAILRRKMKFRELELGRTYGNMVSLLTPIGFALAGFGVWSLVIGNLLGSFISVLAAYYYARWLPRFQFRLWAFKDAFSFGMWVYANNYLTYFINNVDYFLIAKLLNTTQLGFYERAFNLMSFPRKQISRDINSVLFSSYSRIQDENKRIVNAVMKTTTYVSFIAYPIMIWMFFAAPSFITVLYGPKWIYTIYPLQIMCISGLVNVLTMIFNPVLMAKGLVGHRTRRQLIYFCILGFSIYFGVRWGINGVAWAVAISSIIFLLIMFHLIKQHIPIAGRKFFSAQLPPMVYGLGQVGVLIIFQMIVSPYFSIDSWQMLISVTFISITVYLGMHKIIRFKAIDNVYKEIIGELKKVAGKLPLIGRLDYFSAGS